MAKKKIEYDWEPFFKAFETIPHERPYGKKTCLKKYEDNGETPLHLAAENGFLDVCQYYVENGVPFDIKDNANRTPLWSAASEGRKEICRYLLELGADPMATCKHQGISPFHKAAGRGDEMCRLFLKFNVDVNCASDRSMFKGETPFLNAARSAGPDVFTIFLDRGGSLTHIDGDGDTALHKAAAGRKVDNCKLLLERGADLYLTGQRGRTVLHRAVDYCWKVPREELEPLLKFLILERKIPVDIRDKQDNTPLHATVEYRGAAAAELLLEMGADPNARNKKKDTILHLAARNVCSPEFFQPLLKMGADPRMKDAKGQTPLDILLPEVAIQEGYIASAKDDDSRKRYTEYLENTKASVALLEKAMKEWEGKPETVAKKPGKAVEAKPAKKKAVGVVPLKKEITLPTIFNLNLKPDLSLSSKLDQLHEMLGTTLPDYDEFVTKYGKGIVNYSIRVYPPDQVIKELSEFRDRWAEYFLWDDEDSKLDEDDLARSTPLADSIEGDEFVYYPGSDEDKSKKKGFYVLPRHEYSIKYVGKDLGDVFKFARKLFSDFPKDNLIFEGYNDISYQEYTAGELSKSFDDMGKALRKTGKYDHEMMVAGKYLTLCSTKLGGIVDFDFEGKKVFIRCNKDSDTAKIHDALLKLGFEQTVKDKLLYQG